MDFTNLANKAAALGQLDLWAGVSDDEFDTAELELRDRSRAFFIKPQKHYQRRPEPDEGPVTTITTKKRGKQKDGNGPGGGQRPVATTNRVSSAPTPLEKTAAGSHKIIKNTPVSVAAQRAGRLQRGPVRQPLDMPTAGEDTTRIPESARPVVRALRRSDSTPVTSAASKRRQEEGTPSRGTAYTSPKRRRTRRSGTDTTASVSTARTSSTTAPSRLFEGLAFYYIPDNDIAPARRIRITKAKENGASWTKFAKFATHIVVDKNIQYDEIRHIVAAAAAVATGNDEALGSGLERPIVVNENYPIDCVQFRAVLDPCQKKYQLVGQPDGKVNVEHERPPVETVAKEESNGASSLPLKRPQQRDPNRWNFVPPDATPERTSGESSQLSHVGGAPGSQAVALDLERVVESPSPARVETDVNAVGGGEERQVKAPGNHTVESAIRVDELSDYICMMQQYKDVPLDDDDDDDLKSLVAAEHRSGFDEGGSGSGDDRSRNKRAKSSASRANASGHGSRATDYVENFACNQAGPQGAGSENPNARTIEVLQKMASFYDRTNDQWRAMAYRRTISTLKRQAVKITTEREALRLPSIGSRLAQKIEEIVTTDRLQRLEYAQTDPRNEVLRLFLGIYGVGTSQAQQWIAQGFRTLNDLRSKAKLTANQLVGVEHYGDLNTKIPRREVEALGEVVKEAADAIDPSVELIIGGSYRRGAEQSSDIDFIVTKGGTTFAADIRPFLDKLVQRLTRDGFLVARLASSRPGNSDGGGSKWHGCCVLTKERHRAISGVEDGRPLWRRIDFLLVPASEMGAALIYFTGNDLFNRSLRLLASRRGMRLNQRGLYRNVMRGPARGKVSEGELVEGSDERRIFEILGVRWREPHERWC